eukprot:403337044
MNSRLHVGEEEFGPGQILKKAKMDKMTPLQLLKMTIYLVFQCHTLVEEPKFSGFAQFQVIS